MCVPTKPIQTTSATNSNNITTHDFSKYQKLAEYPPDKESTWSHEIEDDGWMHAHNSIRAEMELLITAVEGIIDKPPRLTDVPTWHYLQQAWQCHYDHIDAHHSNEDDLLAPFLSSRFEYPHQHEFDHTLLVAKLESLNDKIAALSARTESKGNTYESLLQALKEYQTMMLPHLAAEEAFCLPLMRAFFTPDEIAPQIKKILSHGPTFEMGSFIACMGVEAFRTKFMVQEGIPDFLWEADFESRYRCYQTDFAAPLEMLKASAGSTNTASSTKNSTNADFVQYQKLSEYPPDKESTWPYKKEDDGWMHAHDSIRAEMGLLIVALDSVRGSPLSAAQIAYIQQAWQCHYEHVHSHHTNEDELMVPFVETRFEYPMQQEYDHTALVAKLEALNAVVAELSLVEGKNTTSESLVQTLKEYRAMMLPHLEAEEVLCLPLMRAFFTPEEIAPIIQKIVGNGPIIECGSFIACMGVDAFQRKYMVQEGIPDFLWEADFQNRYRYYQDNFAKPLELLKIGNGATHAITDFALYQKVPEYPPDKESTWTHEIKDDGWMHAHNSIRTEMAMLIAAVGRVIDRPLSSVQISYIQQVWQCHYEHVHAHHSNEDNLMVPFLTTRFEYPRQLEHDHVALVAKLEALRAMVAALSVSEDTSENVSGLLHALNEYQAMMLPHLAAEETDSLPLMRAYFSPGEIAPVVQQIMAAGPAFEIGSFIACMGVEQFRTKFMVQEGIPDFLWEADFQNRYRYYRDHFETPLDELLKVDGLIEI